MLLVLARRKPERFDVVAAKVTVAGIRFTRRSQLPGPFELPGVLVLDSIGELSGVFALADVVFMGGTLAARGGHNILEPRLCAPVMSGHIWKTFVKLLMSFVLAAPASRLRRLYSLRAVLKTCSPSESRHSHRTARASSARIRPRRHGACGRGHPRGFG